jgi:hypothetical protein
MCVDVEMDEGAAGRSGERRAAPSNGESGKRKFQVEADRRAESADAVDGCVSVYVCVCACVSGEYERERERLCVYVCCVCVYARTCVYAVYPVCCVAASRQAAAAAEAGRGGGGSATTPGEAEPVPYPLQCSVLEATPSDGRRRRRLAAGLAVGGTYDQQFKAGSGGVEWNRRVAPNCLRKRRGCQRTSNKRSTRFRDERKE